MISYMTEIGMVYTIPQKHTTHHLLLTADSIKASVIHILNDLTLISYHNDSVVGTNIFCGQF